MKKQFKLMALASVTMLFAACSQENLLSPQEQLAQSPENNAIQFGTYLGKTGTTRAGVEGQIDSDGKLNGTTEIKTSTKVPGFGVFAYMKGTDGATDCYTGTWNASAPNFMYNQLVSYSAPDWSYNPVKYWPNDFSTTDVDNQTPTDEDAKAQGSVASGKVSFFAYAPYVAVTPSTGVPTSPSTPDYGITALTSNTATTEPKVTYSFKHTTTSPYDYTSNATDNVDLLWGMRGGSETYSLANGGTSVALGSDGYNIDLTKQSTSEKINFKFKHALAKIGGLNGIKVQLDVDNNVAGALDAKSNVTVQSITIKGVADKLATHGTFNIATGQWESPALDGDYEETTLFNITPSTDGINDAIMRAAGSATYSTGWDKTGVTNTAASVFTSGTPAEFYLIPGIAGQQLEVTVTYQVSTYDTNVSGDYVTVNQTIKNVITLPSLDPNKYYTLIMHLGLTSVKFQASVDTWDSTSYGTSESIWLPSNLVP